MVLSGEPVIIAGSFGQSLGVKISEITGIKMGKIFSGKFSDGETRIRIDEDVTGKDAFVVQPTSPPVNDSIMELMLICDALRGWDAGRITAVIPYFGYARQERAVRKGEPIAAEIAADMISSVAGSVITMDIHAQVVMEYFDVPSENICGTPVFASFFREKMYYPEDSVVVAPDLGSITRSRRLSDALGIPLAFTDKKRPDANISEITGFMGDVSGKRCILTDDIIDTAGTITETAAMVTEMGASKVYAFAAHGVLSGEAFEKIYESHIEKVVLLDTVPFDEDKDRRVRGDRESKFEVLSSAGIFAEKITEISSGYKFSEIKKYR